MPEKTSVTDLLDPSRAKALQAALGEPPSIRQGQPLPPFYHQLYFWDAQPPAELGRDGHPKTGGIIPDLGLPRRMWGGGKLAFLRPLIAGVLATKTTQLLEVIHKTGKSGPLALVNLRHDYHQNGTLCLSEHQDLIYREGATPGAPALPVKPAPADTETTEELEFNPTLLFRYSALTFNGHRIHYDRDYARSVEGYSGLVVHGPLLAHLLMRIATRQQGPLETFVYRAYSPLMDNESATLCWQAGKLWVRAPDGRLIMQASAT